MHNILTELISPKAVKNSFIFNPEGEDDYK